MSGLISITISWLQILSALTVTYRLAWPSSFASYSQGIGSVVNLEILSLLSISSCALAVPFINKFLLQAITPPIFITAIFLALLALKCCHRRHKGWKKVQRARVELATQISIIVIQLLYPKLCTYTFQMFRCRDLGPHIGLLLEADFSKSCFAGVHAEYVPLAFVSVFFYMVGVPLATFVIIWRNRKRLHEPKIESMYGDLYRQYESSWAFWEVCLQLQKCLLTGAMVAIAPGSPLQLLIATCVCLAYLLLVLHAAPYKGDLEDRLAFLVSLCLTISLLFGFALITDDPDNTTFDPIMMGALLVVINVLPFVVLLHSAVMIARFGPGFGIRFQGASVATVIKKKSKMKTVDLGARETPPKYGARETTRGAFRHFAQIARHMKRGEEAIKQHHETSAALQSKLGRRRIASQARLSSRIVNRSKIKPVAPMQMETEMEPKLEPPASAGVEQTAKALSM
jgi:hypothetical protein